MDAREGGGAGRDLARRLPVRRAGGGERGRHADGRTCGRSQSRLSNHPLEANYAISQLNDQQIAVFIHDSRENARLSQALGPIQAKKTVIASIADEIAHRQAEINKIAQDQHRLRENMGALKGGSGERQLLARYLAQLNQQEDRIAVLRRESADLEQRLAQSQAELAGLIQALALDIEVLDAAEADGPDTAFAPGEPAKRQ